jgi:hypothetical protein
MVSIDAFFLGRKMNILNYSALQALMDVAYLKLRKI